MSRLRLVWVPLLFATLSFQPARSQEDWTVVFPATIGAGSDCLSGVDGTSWNDVWAVGTWEDLVFKTLIQHFDGTSWTKFPAPFTGNSEGMVDVLAISPVSVIAVGRQIIAGKGQPLAMQWNGSEWELIATPVFENPGGADFSAIDQSPEGTIWVSGFLYGTAFLARKTGEGWAIEYAPLAGGERNNFYNLDARSDTEIWAVGAQSEAQGQRRLLVQRFDGGGNWTTFDVPPPDGFVDRYELDSFTGVDAVAANDVWAVGYYYDRVSGRTPALVMHYEGTAWTKASLPLLSGDARLEDVTATGPADIYAAGTTTPTGGVQRSYMLHYDGVSWTDVTLPATGGSYEWLLGMGIAPEGQIWVVGQYYDGTTTEPITFRKAGTSTGIGDSPLAGRAVLSSFPNPFRYGTSVTFVLDRPGSVRLRVWDVAGRLVRTLVEREMPAGRQTVHWDGLDSHRRPAAAGVYFCDLNHDGRPLAGQKLVRLR